MFRAERTTMQPFRNCIGELQRHVAFAVALASSGRTPAHGELEADFATMRQSIEALLRDISRAAPGPSLGPADNCRRALEVLLERIASTAT